MKTLLIVENDVVKVLVFLTETGLMQRQYIWSAGALR